MTDDELRPEQRRALRDARTPIAPPPALEQATVSALRERGLIYPRRGRAVGVWMAIAATILALVAWSVARRPAPASGPRYVLLLYAGSDPIAGAGDDRRREYGDWARQLASRGVDVSGEELAPESAALGAPSASASGPEPRGFFIVRAADLAAAQQIASTCPHLRHGGRIVIKRVAS